MTTEHNNDASSGRLGFENNSGPMPGLGFLTTIDSHGAVSPPTR